MANAKEIRSQIKSVKNTQKITKAMEMVAASKVRRVQEHMRAGRPYAEHILRVIAHLAKATSHHRHRFLTQTETIEKVGYIVITTDRGLCGGLNVNLFKTLMESVAKERAAGREVVASVFGGKGVNFLSRAKIAIVSAVEDYPEQPQTHQLIGGTHPLIDAYSKGEIQQIYLVGNLFVNAMAQRPYIEQLLPASIAHADNMTANHAWDYLYDPSAGAILENLLRRYIESIIRQAVSENVACEMSARMVAMKSASDNAGSLIDELQLQYNKARQAAITQELSEIVAGADAV